MRKIQNQMWVVADMMMVAAERVIFVALGAGVALAIYGIIEGGVLRSPYAIKVLGW